jgi:phage I-like protein
VNHYFLLQLAEAADGKIQVPERLRVLRAGRNESKKGAVFFTSRSASAVMEAYGRRGGVECRVDYEHASHLPLEDQTNPAEQSAAAGFFQPEVDDSGNLWVVFTQWSAKGREKVEGGEFRYLSPTLRFVPLPEGEEAGLEVVEILSVALTNHPALEGAPALFSTAKEKPVKRMFQEYLSKCKMGRETLCEKMGLEADCSDDDLECAFQAKLLSSADPFAPPQTAPAPTPPPVVGMSADEFLVKVTGAKDPEAAKGQFAALFSSVGEIPKLRDENAHLRTEMQNMAAEARRAKRAAELDALAAAGRVTPAQRELAIALSDAEFKGFLAALPERSIVTPPAAPQPRERPAAGDEVALNADEEHAFRLLGHFGHPNFEATGVADPAVWAQHKKTFLAAGGWRATPISQ